MKTSINIFAFLIIISFTFSLPNFAQVNYDTLNLQWNNNTDPIIFSGDDHLVDLPDIPNNTTGGLPMEIKFVPGVNKYYVYSHRNIIVLDGTTKEPIKKIKISDMGSIGFEGGTKEFYYSEKRLAYNPALNCIYCASNDKTLKVINCVTDEIEKSFDFILPTGFIGEFNEIYYNANTNKISWFISDWADKAMIKTIDGNTNTELAERLFQETTIYTISGDEAGNRLFISCENANLLKKYIKVISSSTLEDVAIIETAQYSVNILHNGNTNKLYLAPIHGSYIRVLNCQPGQYSYLYDIPCASEIKRLCLNPTISVNRVYACGYNGNPPVGYLTIIDGNNDQIVSSIMMQNPNTLYYSSVSNSVFCGGHSQIVKIEGNSNSISAQSYNNVGGMGHSLTMDETSGILACANPEAGHVTFFDCRSSGQWIELLDYTQTGGSTQNGCYNSTNNKYYFIQNDSYNSKSFVSIYNATTNELINSIALEGSCRLRKCAYNEMYNKIYITSELSSKVFVLSGDDDFNVSAVIDEVYSAYYLYSIPESNIIVCGSYNKIYFFDAEDNGVMATINNPPDEIQFTDFVISELFPDILYACGGYTGCILKINLNNFEIVNTINTGLYLTDFAYDNENYKLYVINQSPYSSESFVTIVNESDFSLEPAINASGGSLEIIYNPLNRLIYLLSRWGITILQNNDIIKEVYIPGVHSCGLFLNPINNKLYFHTLVNFAAPGMPYYMTTFDCDNEKISHLFLGQGSCDGGSYDNIDEQMVYNPGNNQLIFGNRGFSNLSIVQCGVDKLQLNSGYRWISFPRMPRYAFADDPYHTESVFTDNMSYWGQLDFTLNNQEYPPKIKQFIHYPTPVWTGNLNSVQSTLGYQLYIPPIDDLPPTLTLKGARLDPDFSVSLPGGGQTKWTGYFIKESQMPWQAFPPDVYNTKLQSIKAQYWSMFKNETKGWTVTGKVTPIKYGDMVQIKTNQPGLINFQWNNPDESAADMEVPDPQAYSWEELPEYTPFFIETDAGSDIEEIAVMVNGECMGATVVQTSDTLVEVDGYFGDLPAGSTVEFETWNGYKSSPVEKGNYIVYNPLNGRKEKRNIYTGERRDYYMLSFKQGETGEIPADICDVSCQPNPFDKLTTLSMRLNRDQKITVNVVDINGMKVKTLIDRNMTGGYYEISWAGDNDIGSMVKRGVYFYKITSAEGSEVTGKIVKID